MYVAKYKSLIFSTQIEDSCCDDSAGCLTEVINQWSCSGQPTWRELGDHLSKIGEEQLSKELMTIYGTSEYSQCIRLQLIFETPMLFLSPSTTFIIIRFTFPLV